MKLHLAVLSLFVLFICPRLSAQIAIPDSVLYDGWTNKEFIRKQECSLRFFPADCWTEIRKYFSQNVRYPYAQDNISITGRVSASFVIDKSGEPTDIILIEKIDSLLDKQLTDLIKSSPKWAGSPYLYCSLAGTKIVISVNFANYYDKLIEPSDLVLPDDVAFAGGITSIFLIEPPRPHPSGLCAKMK